MSKEIPHMIVGRAEDDGVIDLVVICINGSFIRL